MKFRRRSGLTGSNQGSNSGVSLAESMSIELPVTDPGLRRRIEERAFEIWKSEGFPSGRDWAHWVQAENEIFAELEAGATDEWKDTSGKKPGEAS
jgi:hypothetical protein